MSVKIAKAMSAPAITSLSTRGTRGVPMKR
jgi:hypothetical protein